MFHVSPTKGIQIGDRSPSGDSKGPPDTTPPRVTYRHLLSAGSLVPSNPLRVIAHCDVDAAYAAFEAKRLGVNPFEQPLAVQQWNGLIAISYAARAYGITRHETIDSALKKCPHLQLVHVATYAAGATEAAYNSDPTPETHKVSLDPYRRESAKILTIFQKTCPSGNVEKASIDESYFDLTVEVRKLIIQKYPHLGQVPKDSLGMDTPLPDPPKVESWEEKELGYLVPIGGEKKEETQQEEIKEDSINDPTSMEAQTESSSKALQTEGVLDLKDLQEENWSWTDVALAMGAELMARVRKEVQNQLGYTTSAGIAPNKTLAKLCSSYKKPNAQTTMRLAAIPGFLKDLPFQKIRFLGGKLGGAINQEWESSTVGDLWNVSLRDMQAKFGDESLWVWNVLRGVDHSEVRERVANKTMLASKSVRPPITRSSEASHWLSILSTELCVRLHEARETSPTLWPKTLVLRYIRSGDAARSRQTSFPFTKNLNTETLLKSALKLWVEAFGEGENLNGGAEGSNVKISIVTIALGFSGLEKGEVGQKSLQGFFSAAANPNPSSPSRAKNQEGKAGSDQKRIRSTSPSIELPREEGRNLGPQTVSSSSKTSHKTEPPAKKKKSRPDGIEALFRKASASQSTSRASNKDDSIKGASTSTSASLQQDQPQVDDLGTNSFDSKSHTWSCPQCKETLSSSLPESMGSDQDLDLNLKIELQRLVQDHQDWHFAMSIQDEDRNSFSAQQTQTSTSTQTKNKKKKKRPLDAFFKATPSQK